MASARANRRELFEVGGTPRRKAYLAQKPQFFKQRRSRAGLGKIFESASVSRNPSFKSRQRPSSQCRQRDSWIDRHEDVMNMHEELIVAVFPASRRSCEEIKGILFDVDVVVPFDAFPASPREAKRTSRAGGQRCLVRATGTRWASARSLVCQEVYDHEFVL